MWTQAMKMPLIELHGGWSFTRAVAAIHLCCLMMTWGMNHSGVFHTWRLFHNPRTRNPYKPSRIHWNESDICFHWSLGTWAFWMIFADVYLAKEIWCWRTIGKRSSLMSLGFFVHCPDLSLSFFSCLDVSSAETFDQLQWTLLDCNVCNGVFEGIDK